MVGKEFSRYLFGFIKTQFKITSIFLAFSLIFGVFLVPRETNASLLSSIFGSEVVASSEAPSSDQDGKNSQNMLLLQANVSSSILNKDTKDKATDLDENESISILSSNALLPSTSIVSISGTDVEDSSFDQISVYVVRKGDSMAQIAKMFNVSVNTILSANDMKKGQNTNTLILI